MILGLGNTIPSDSVRQGLGGGGGGGFDNTYSLAFDGIDDYVDTGITTTGTNDVSISCWIKTSETFASSESRCAFGGSDITFGANYTLGRLGSEFGSPNDMKVRVFNTFGTTKLNDNSWHNIIYTYDYTSKEVKVYVDGNTTPEISTTQSLFRSKKIAIGWNGTTPSYRFEGNVDEASYFNSVLTPANVTSIYNSGTPNDISSISGLTAWYRNGDNGSYKSPQWLIPENSNKDKVSNYSFAFDGIGDNINLGTSVLDGLGAFSISFWFNTSYNDWQYFMGDNSFRLTMKQSTDDVRINFNGSAVYRADPLPVTLNTWNNFVFVFDGSLSQADRMKLYLNGSLATNILGGTPDTTFVASNNFRLARVGSFSAKLFVGMMDDVAFFNTALTSGNVTSIYNSGEPTTLPSGTVAHYKMGEQATFSTNWTIPDGVGSADGTSENMTIEDRVGEASGSTSNSLSYNMTESDRETDVPT